MRLPSYAIKMLLLKLTPVLLVIALIMAFVRWRRGRRQMLDMIAKLPGPTSSGMTLLEIAALIVQCQELADLYRVNTYVIAYSMLLGLARAYIEQGMTYMWLGVEPVVILFSPETIEPVLSHSRVLNKSFLYRAFEPWTGEGLVTSKRNKWHFRRKILTPAFHFRILSDFLPIINSEASKLVEKLNQAHYLDGRRVNIMPPIALCTLDTICETAMGCSLNSQSEKQLDDAPYVKALHQVASAALARVLRPWLWPDIVFFNSSTGRSFVKARDLMHDFSSRVIKERKAEWELILAGSDGPEQTLEPNSGETKKITFEQTRELKFAQKADKRMAFLDLLLHQHLIEKTMTLKDIQEEVDTFMFAGHDTTAINISWTLYMLGLHPEIQTKARAEIDSVLGNVDQPSSTNIQSVSDEFYGISHSSVNEKLLLDDVDSKHLREMKYLEQVIKEALRMWPSIPFVAREMTENVGVGANREHIIPKGATCMIFTQALHHNPRIYSRPEVFDPERFSSDQIASRHPFAYIPFSAGPRNCIGQRYAQMEVKIIVAKVLRNFIIESCEPLDKLHTVGEMVLRPANGLFVRLKPRYCI